MEVTGKVLVLVLLLALTVCATAKNLKNATRVLLADEKYAVCLDGSVPGYYWRPGQDKSSTKWILHLMGGGWCDNKEDCLKRSQTRLGSTSPKFYSESMDLSGFLSDDPQVNPDFHDWNVVYFIYCDGGSFAGDKKEPDMVNGTRLYFRGYPILKAIVADLKTKGMSSASDVILTGSSAGGLAVYLHADFVHTLLPPTTKYKALPDAGYFIDIPTVNGDPAYLNGSMLIECHNMQAVLVLECMAKHTSADSWKCVYPPYLYNNIKTPLFVLNSQYDTAQLSGLYKLPCLPPKNCSTEDMKLLQHFNQVFMEKLQPVLASTSNGYFIDSCLIHTQAHADKSWTMITAQGHPLRESFADWYYERPSSEGATRVVDCKYPCNPTCPARSELQNSMLFL